jgi:proline iminopeptidase
VVEAYCRRLQHPDASIRESAALLRDAARIADIPGVLVQGRFDFQSPLANARALQRCWPGAQLVVVNDAGHAADHSGISAELKRALVRFATR